VHAVGPLQRFVAIDVEVASRHPLRVCSVGAVRVEDGEETAHVEALVRVNGPIAYSRIHGLTAAELRRAPQWPAVWPTIVHLADGVAQFAAFRADFDRGAILTMCSRHGLRPPPLPFVCVAALAAKRLGRSQTLAEYLTSLGIDYPGKPHDALSDARAAAALLLAIGRQPNARPAEP
jgi:DNA polymerase-3 subunit epsilon